VARPIFTARPAALARIPLLPASGPSRGTADSGSPLLDEAVTLASQSARNAGGHGRTGALTWQAYATRARTRTTPAGAFAGVTTATFSTTTTELCLGPAHRTTTYPDPGWLRMLASGVLDSQRGLEAVTLTTSNLTVVRGDRYEIEPPITDGPVRPAMTSVRATEVTRFVLRACRDGAPAAAVLAEMTARWPAGSGPRLLRELLDWGFLLHDLLPDDPRDDPLGHVLGRLPPDSPLRRPLDRLRACLGDADRHRPGSPERLKLITDALATARGLRPADRVLRVDTAADATVTLPASVARKAAEAASVLWRVGWGTDPLNGYHQRFLTRYGTARAVPLLDVLDPVIGLGPVEDPAAIGAGAGDPARAAVLARLLADAAVEGKTEIALDEATVDRLADRHSGSAPRTAEIYVRVIADPAAACRLGIAVSGGSQDAGSSGGRFALLLGRPPGPHEEGEHEDGGTVTAELLVRPRLSSLASVTAETGLAAHRIPVGVAPRPGDLDPAELTVFSDGHRLIVWSPALDRPVRPLLFARTALPLLPAVAQFLAMAGHSGERPWHCWSWAGVAAPFTPAIRYRGTWLAPARWALPRHLTAAAADPDQWGPALQAWRSAGCPRPPDVVVTDDADRQLMLDLRRADGRELLRRYARRGLLAVTAPPGGDRAAVLPGPDGGHLLELVVSLDRTAPASAAPQVAPPARRAGEDLHLPGGPWLSIAVQAPTACHETILRSLAEIVEASSGGWDRWFWLRYRDSRRGEHVRIRFHGDPAQVCGVLLPSLARWAAGLRSQRLISGFCVEPYEQETERYGGPAAITAAERFFDADSRHVLGILKTTRSDDQRLVAAVGAAVVICGRIGTGTLSTTGLDRATHRRVNALRDQARNAVADPLPPEWHAALEDYRAALGRPTDTIASDLIHLHCNRLVPGAEPLVRALAADLIAHRAHLTGGPR
jgi:thiopeptide-type bacteriocin biosynthesis protein